MMTIKEFKNSDTFKLMEGGVFTLKYDLNYYKSKGMLDCLQNLQSLSNLSIDNMFPSLYNELVITYIGSDGMYS